ncbi:hypothetical protein [Algibacillus agarilyticus]|uniref:hypothetical protein n=1 Tax=Algibacillus agarilyticus TaxID=2234133 RepID=UPI000DCFC699|nr:hypothetical protein [Algibacillus agarilyticus]
MPIKVAHKIIAGFALITLLLIFSSVMSLSSLSGVANVTHQVSAQALPLQAASNTLQVNFLQISKSSQQALLLTNVDKVNAVAQQTSLQQKQFQQTLRSLQALSQSHTQFSTFAQNIERLSQQYFDFLALIFQAHQANLAYTPALTEEMDVILEFSRDTLIILDDILDTSEHNIALELSGQSKTFLIAMVEHFKDANVAQSSQAFNTLKQAIDIKMADMNKLVTPLIDLDAGAETNGLSEEYQVFYEELIRTILLPSGFLAVKQKQLQEIESARNSVT